MAWRLPTGCLELRPAPRRSPHVNLLLTFVNKQKFLKLAQESSAEVGVLGNDM